MIPTVGQKVWVENGGGDFPAGVHAAVVIQPQCGWGEDGWWDVEFENLPNHPKGQSAQDLMRPRDNPPPQQEPKRDAVGSWDACEWKPAREIA